MQTPSFCLSYLPAEHYLHHLVQHHVFHGTRNHVHHHAHEHVDDGDDVDDHQAALSPDDLPLLAGRALLLHSHPVFLLSQHHHR